MIFSDSNSEVEEVKKNLYRWKMGLARFYKTLTFVCFGVTTVFLLLMVLPIPNVIYNLKVTKFFVLETVGLFSVAIIFGNLASFLDWSDKSTRRFFTSVMYFAGALLILMNVIVLFLAKIGI